MRKLLFFWLVLVAFWSCSVDTNVNEDFYFEILPIKTVEMPTSVRFNETFTINYTYSKPSTCHFYNDLYFISEGNTRTIAVINTVINETSTTICEPLMNDIEERSFEFHVKNDSGTYIFKFWQGEDDNGHDTYLVFEVPIVQ